MPKNIAIETAENQLGNAGTKLWRHLVNTDGSPQYSALGVPPPPRLATDARGVFFSSPWWGW